MQKVFKHLECHKLGCAMLPSRYIDIEVLHEVDDPVAGGIAAPDVYEWLISVRLSRKMIGPPEAQKYFLKETRRAMAKEIFGELQDDCLELIIALQNETYRPPNDPVLMLAEKLMSKLRGEA